MSPWACPQILKEPIVGSLHLDSLFQAYCNVVLDPWEFNNPLYTDRSDIKLLPFNRILPCITIAFAKVTSMPLNNLSYLEEESLIFTS